MVPPLARALHTYTLPTSNQTLSNLRVVQSECILPRPLLPHQCPDRPPMTWCHPPLPATIAAAVRAQRPISPSLSPILPPPGPLPPLRYGPTLIASPAPSLPLPHLNRRGFFGSLWKFKKLCSLRSIRAPFHHRPLLQVRVQSLCARRHQSRTMADRRRASDAASDTAAATTHLSPPSPRIWSLTTTASTTPHSGERDLVLVVSIGSASLLPHTSCAAHAQPVIPTQRHLPNQHTTHSISPDTLPAVTLTHTRQSVGHPLPFSSTIPSGPA